MYLWVVSWLVIGASAVVAHRTCNRLRPDGFDEHGWDTELITFLLGPITLPVFAAFALAFVVYRQGFVDGWISGIDYEQQRGAGQ